MKRKAITLFLLIIAMTVWGIIAIKIVKVTEHDKISTEKKDMTAGTKIDVKYLLKLNYRDPFRTRKEAVKVNVEHDIKHVNEKIYDIECCGKFTKGNISYYSIKINGRFYTLKTGEAADGLRLITRRNDTLKFIGDDNCYYYSCINDAHGDRNFQHYK